MHYIAVELSKSQLQGEGCTLALQRITHKPVTMASQGILICDDAVAAGSSHSPDDGEKKPPASSVPAASLKRHAVKEWLRAGSQGQGQLFGDVAERWDGADEEQIAAADALIKG